MTPLSAAYDERNRVVAALARSVYLLYADEDPTMVCAWRGKHVDDPREATGKPWDPEWLNVIYIKLPTGQCSWHIHDRDLPLFEWLPFIPFIKWDGHTSAEKYERIAKYSRGEW